MSHLKLFGIWSTKVNWQQIKIVRNWQSKLWNTLVSFYIRSHKEYYLSKKIWTKFFNFWSCQIFQLLNRRLKSSKMIQRLILQMTLKKETQNLVEAIAWNSFSDSAKSFNKRCQTLLQIILKLYKVSIRQIKMSIGLKWLPCWI